MVFFKTARAVLVRVYDSCFCKFSSQSLLFWCHFSPSLSERWRKKFSLNWTGRMPRDRCPGWLWRNERPFGKSMRTIWSEPRSRRWIWTAKKWKTAMRPSSITHFRRWTKVTIMVTINSCRFLYNDRIDLIKVCVIFVFLSWYSFSILNFYICQFG